MQHHILDSSAWLECLDAGPNVKHFGPILRKLPNLIIPAIVLTEVRKVALKQRSAAEAEAVTDSMRSGIVIPADETISILAADLFIKYKLPLADSIIYATALIHKATLWTQDDDFKDLPNVKYFPKSKS
ncbi:MAG: type II toxin-antitoxin system VapC family toxin [Akkermansiaceae bacterium]|jgi:predicted nucleic acid-binding protein|nr:type II toxin-antitoxin system VapC family toxin [Luteolibacter sp.]